jgi:hypothetical protein
LQAVARSITGTDAIDLWEFDDALAHIGSTRDAAVRSGGHAPTDILLGLIRKLNPPRGGTEIGGVLASVIARSSARDILLITDGKSYALDVQALARLGRRISLVLVGEDSLEANVGHLSASTGGEIFVAANNDLTTVLVDALLSLRVPHVAPEPMSGRVHAASARRAGMIIKALWKDASSEGAGPAPIDMRAVAAVATSLVLPALSTEAAALLAETEGLVTHLTSLVLVDEAGDVQETILATRKIALPTPRTAMARACVAAAPPAACADRETRGLHAAKRSRSALGGLRELFSPPPVGKLIPADVDFEEDSDLFDIGDAIVWDEAPHKLRSGDLSMLPGYAESAIREAAAHSDVVALARTLGLDPAVLVIGLLAYASRRHRSAARLARAIFGGAIPASALAVARTLGIDRSAA